MVKVNRERQLWVLNCNTCGKEVISKLYCRSCFEGYCFDCVVFKQPHFSCPISSHVKGGIIGIQICCKCQCCRYLRRPLPKQNYGNDMAKTGPYLTHIWEWYGKVK